MNTFGDRITISSIERDTTVADLATSLSVASLVVDGESVDQSTPLVEVDSIRRGVRLTGPSCSDRESPSASCSHMDDPSVSTDVEPAPPMTVVDIAVVAGPACSVWIGLESGRHIVGRAPHTDIQIDDALIELHHAVLDVGADGTVTFTQLAGAIPALIDGQPLDAAATLEPGTPLCLGASIIELRKPGGRDSGRDACAPDVARPRGSIASHVSDPWRRVVWRSPVDTADWEQPAIVSPRKGDEPAGPAVTTLVGAAVAALGAVAIATLMDNVMFLVFAGVGALTAVTTWCVSTLVAWRRRRRIRAEYQDDVDRFRSDLDDLVALRRRFQEQHHRRPARAFEIALDFTGDVWSQRAAPIEREDDATARVPLSHAPSHRVLPGGLAAVIGDGTARWSPLIDGIGDDAQLAAAVDAACSFDRAPIPLTIGHGDVIALHGPIATGRAVARSLVAQLATLTGPADWRLLVLTREIDEWEWSNWLPHGALRGVAVVALDDRERLATELAALDRSQRIVVITDDPTLFTTRTGPLRRMLAASGAASIVVVDTDATVPALCRRVLHIGATGRARWIGDIPASDDAVDIRVGGITVELAERVARRLACLVDPEDDDADGAGVPTTVAFDDVIGGVAAGVGSMTPSAVMAAWEAGGVDPAPRAPIGWSSDGLIEIDLVRDGPHGLVAGTTGSGKSELLRSLVVSLALHVSPEHLNVVLVDYKGGSTFDACVELPHTVGLVTDLDDGLAERALISLTAELHRRERLLRSVGASDLTDYRARPGVGTIARLVVVIDEFAALAKELPEFLAALVDIAQRGRSLGVHLLLATQRPAGVVNDDIRANTNLRIALRLHDRADAVDVVNDATPASFPRDVPGRAALRLGPDELAVFQATRCTGEVADESRSGLSIATVVPVGRAAVASTRDDLGGAAVAVVEARPSELETAVDCIVAAARDAGIEQPHRPWLEPLPFPLTAADFGESWNTTSIGVIDDPAHQSRLALSWDPSHGSLALIGATGSGTTSTLISLASATCRSWRPDDLHLYVVDARGDDGLGALASLAHCGAVVRVTEGERLQRVFARLVEAIDRRLSGTTDEAGPEVIVVVIDGWSTLRAAMSTVERTELNELVGRVMSEGPGVGVVSVVADGGSTAAASLAVGDRWVFQLDDPAVSRSFGVRVPVGGGRPGRLRIASTGLEAQVAVGAAGLAEIASRDVDTSGPSPVGALPDHVMRSPGNPVWTSKRVATGTQLVVGLGSRDLQPDGPTVPTGDSLLIVGAARTGVTSTVETCVAAWQSINGDRILRIDRRHPIDLDELDNLDEGASNLLIVVDDAHRIDDDAHGTFAAIARGDRPNVMLLAGARADAVRSAYGHWTREVAKARCGMVMSNRGDPDGDVLGVTIPRRALVATRPGLGWIVDGGVLRQIQAATVHK